MSILHGQFEKHKLKIGAAAGIAMRGKIEKLFAPAVSVLHRTARSTFLSRLKSPTVINAGELVTITENVFCFLSSAFCLTP